MVAQKIQKTSVLINLRCYCVRCYHAVYKDEDLHPSDSSHASHLFEP
jgi:hypothetical protein